MIVYHPQKLYGPAIRGKFAFWLHKSRDKFPVGAIQWYDGWLLFSNKQARPKANQCELIAFKPSKPT